MHGILILLLSMQAAPDAAPLAPLPDPLPNEVLAAQRGGFRLPSGIDVALTVQTQTAINGAVVLRSVFQADHGTPTLTVYAPRSGETVAAGGGNAGASGDPAMPVVTYDSRNGIQISASGGTPAVSLTLSGGAAPVAAGLVPVTGEGVVTDNGTVSQSTRGALQVAELRAADLTITHLAGSAFGTAIANAGNDRAIDTSTAIGIDLHNAGPDVLGSSMLRVQDVAINAMQFRQ
ncbi:hypothetical protein ASG67_09990 [Sphingomonas sp. Leaf339]|uniref:hypothetical protein n=1 Tax=Sphingomonas sp. Leaf339 TaxID=1736343 RepID=UPI000700138D|nr:hypothetical protein [Sphingomonas sp. Leaf339]KQU53146.1 hypothetical protein ASG67_09990 [Sphingomonas sp. Leaf339]